VRLVWVRSDPTTLRAGLTARESGWDTGKVAGFPAFTARKRLGDRPAMPHAVIDNRLGAAAPLEEQVAALLAQGYS
jgi:hypothetical protein